MILNLTSGNGEKPIKLQSKTVDPKSTQSVILPDNGYNGLSSVVVNAISGDYIGGDVPQQNGGVYTPTTNNKIVCNGGTYIKTDVIVQGDLALTSNNIRNGVSIFGVQGTYSGDSRFMYENMTLSSSGNLYIEMDNNPRYIHYMLTDFTTPPSGLYTPIMIQATRTDGSSNWNIAKIYSMSDTRYVVAVSSSWYPTINYVESSHRLYINANSQLALKQGTIVYSY